MIQKISSDGLSMKREGALPLPVQRIGAYKDCVKICVKIKIAVEKEQTLT